MSELFATVEVTGRKYLQKLLMQYVAKCFKVAWCCHEDMAAWQSSREVQVAENVAETRQWFASQEELYRAGLVPSLPSSSSEDEGSELPEVFETDEEYD
jgi:hypothetical protein